jgi:hypothetical protein
MSADGTLLGLTLGMKHNDPELIRLYANERKTVDLCGQQHGRARCVRTLGHEGLHEALAWDRSEPLRWK